LALFITQYYFGIEIAPIPQNDLTSLLFVLAGFAFIVDVSDEAINWCINADLGQYFRDEFS